MQPPSTPAEVLIGIMIVWVVLSLVMGGKKAYFDTYDHISEESEGLL